MVSEVFTASTFGVDAYIVRVESHMEKGLFSFSIVGLPDNAVKESRERVSAAIKNSGLDFPIRRFTINLSPADVKKEGSGFDLPIAIGILSETGQINPGILNKFLFIGELSLDGKLRKVPGILPITIEAKKQGFKGIFLPEECADEAAFVEDFEIYPVTDIKQVVNFLNGKIELPLHKIDVNEIFESHRSYLVDFADVKGQAEVKRAMEVAAAGAHNIILIGLPGSGKTMLAKRLPTILPPLTLDEALETTKIHSIAGILPTDTPIISTRPFRSPHHTASDVSLVGGGPNAKPGEISFAHNGVLFLDELTEFKKNVLEVMRQPLEDRIVTISRSKITVSYPCNFMLVAAMNPTPAGSQKEMDMYSQYDIQKFLSKISGPILDRIDIHVHVNPVKYDELSSKTDAEKSDSVRERVTAARKIQFNRFKDLKGIYANSQMSSKEIKKYCVIGSDGEEIMKMAITRLGLSARAFDRILKVSRTIADLNAEENISTEHLSEAIQYRSLDRAEWMQ